MDEQSANEAPKLAWAMFWKDALSKIAIAVFVVFCIYRFDAASRDEQLEGQVINNDLAQVELESTRCKNVDVAASLELAQTWPDKTQDYNLHVQITNRGSCPAQIEKIVTSILLGKVDSTVSQAIRSEADGKNAAAQPWGVEVSPDTKFLKWTTVPGTTKTRVVALDLAPGEDHIAYFLYHLRLPKLVDPHWYRFESTAFSEDGVPKSTYVNVLMNGDAEVAQSVASQREDGLP